MAIPKRFAPIKIVGDFCVWADNNKWSRIINGECGRQTSDAGPAVIITGSARGGTSLLASMFFHIGVPMGKEQGPRYEDRRLQKYFIDRGSAIGLRKLKRRVGVLQAAGSIWGWKLPALAEDLDLVKSIVSKPRFIFVFKDPFTVAMRRENSLEGRTFIVSMKRTLRAYDKMLRFAESSDLPCLLMSYEGFVADLDAHIPVVARFAGLELSADDVKRVRAGLKRDSDAYRTPGSIEERYTAVDSKPERANARPDATSPIYPRLRTSART